MKQSTKFVMTLLLLGLSITAYAEPQCTPYVNKSNTVTFANTIPVPTSLPVGAQIASQAFAGPFLPVSMHCYEPITTIIRGRYKEEGISLPGVGVVYRTNVSGIGIRVTATSSNGAVSPVRLTDWFRYRPSGAYPYNIIGMRAEFYKIGPVTPGTVPSGNLSDETWVGPAAGRIYIGLNNSIRFGDQAATCDLAAGDVNRTITLPSIKVSDLTNATSAGAFDFNLTANCSNASSVTFRFTGTPAANDTWRFANTGTAGGTALWLYSRIGGINQTIRANGTDSTRAVAVSNNRAVLPLGAAYFKTGTVSQGTLASTATVNITYN
ncbi:fimbrial protein [Pseudomonas fluorescens]|nr:fimbrial protein [Pseudomonas fluorescens]